VLQTPDEFGRGYVLYSVGDDGVDDGGSMRARSWRSPADGSRGVRGKEAGDLDLNPADVPFKFKE
jgi:hypothetical protein